MCSRMLRVIPNHRRKGRGSRCFLFIRVVLPTLVLLEPSVCVCFFLVFSVLNPLDLSSKSKAFANTTNRWMDKHSRAGAYPRCPSQTSGFALFVLFAALEADDSREDEGLKDTGNRRKQSIPIPSEQIQQNRCISNNNKLSTNMVIFLEYFTTTNKHIVYHTINYLN